jgi:WD40 repeat protein
MPGKCESVAVSVGGSMVAAGDDKGHLMVWDARGALLVSSAAHRSAVTAIAFDDTGDRLATAASGESVRLWSIRSGRSSALVSVGECRALAFAPDGRVLAIGNGSRVELLSTGSGPAVVLAPTLGAPPSAIAWHPFGEHLAVAGTDGVVRVWDRDGRAIERRDLKIGSLISLGWRGGMMVVGSAEGSLCWWSLSSGNTDRRETADGRIVTGAGDTVRPPRLPPVYVVRTAASPHGEVVAIGSNGESGVSGEVWIIRP